MDRPLLNLIRHAPQFFLVELTNGAEQTLHADFAVEVRRGILFALLLQFAGPPPHEREQVVDDFTVHVCGTPV